MSDRRCEVIFAHWQLCLHVLYLEMLCVCAVSSSVSHQLSGVDKTESLLFFPEYFPNFGSLLIFCQYHLVLIGSIGLSIHRSLRSMLIIIIITICVQSPAMLRGIRLVLVHLIYHSVLQLGALVKVSFPVTRPSTSYSSFIAFRSCF